MRWLGPAVIVAASSLAPPSHAQTTAGTPPLVVYADQASPTSSLWRAWTGAAWSPAATASTAAGTPICHDLAVCSDWVRMALLRIDSDNRVRLQRWDSGAWDAPVTLTSNCGSHSSKVAAAAYEHDSRELLVVYREGSSNLSWRSYSQQSPPETSLWLGFIGPTEWITLVPCPGSDRILLLVSASDRLYAAVWDGDDFGSVAMLEDDLPHGGRPFDAAFTTASGKAVVVWATTGGSVRSRVWRDGWQAATPAGDLGAGARWIALAADPEAGSDEVLMATLDTSSDVSLNRFNGTAWGVFTEVENNAGATDERRIDIAYQPDGARALAAWHRAGETRVRYRAWNGVSWSSTQAGPNLGSEPQRIIMAPGREDDQVLMAVRRRGAQALLDYLAYSEDGTLETAGVTFEGPTGAGVPGVTLPAPPPGTSNSNNLSYGNHATVTLAPGIYGSVSGGNNLTLNLRDGTYVFRQILAGNNLRLNLDTNGGDIGIIIDNGNLAANNNAEFVNTGDGRVRFHIKNGNLDLKHNLDVADADFFVYSGTIELGHNADVRGVLYASGDIAIESGTVRVPTSYTGGAGIVSAVVWTGGVPGPVATLVAAVPGPAESEAVAIGRRPPFLPPRITLWREIDPATVP